MGIPKEKLVLGALLAIANAGASETLLPNSLSVIVGDKKYTAEIDRCVPLQDMLLVRAESDGDEEHIKILFRDSQDKRGLTFQVTYEKDGVQWRENWDAKGDMVETNSLDDKFITAAGKIKRELVRTSADGNKWRVHPDSDSEEQSAFILTAHCS